MNNISVFWIKMYRSRSDKLFVLAFIGLFILVFSQTKNGECTERPISGQCCYNYHLVGNRCEACPPGFFGNNCINACPKGSYGNLCGNECIICSISECHPVYGCAKPTISTLVISSQVDHTTSLLSTYRENSTRKSADRPPFTTEIPRSTLKQFSISTRLITPSVRGDNNNNNTVIIAVGGAITLCLIILIIQVGYKQILQCKRKKRRLSSKQDHTEETYQEITEIDLNTRKCNDGSKEKTKYNILNRVPEVPGRGYREIQEIQIPEETRSGGTLHSDSSGESYVSPNENASLHTYTPVIDSNGEDMRARGPSGSNNYLSPVFEIHVPYSEHADSDSSHSSTQYNDIALTQCVNRADEANIYLDVTNE